ncbi:hypothetical protein LTR22_010074 [Elasticomyces elasticus]|nr:hypothetical protein LTR22_010074 [Elasticomyces elasticus]
MVGPVHTITALRRWSCGDKQLPSTDRIKSIHIYDFDNTLFSSPLPNRQVWSTQTCGHLQAQDFLHGGGWWHNPQILASTRQGLEVEEARAWEGCWNEKIVDLVRLSMSEEDALTILLTGRAEAGFADLINRMAAAKGLDFDMVCLKPAVSPTGELFASTLGYKQSLLRDIVMTYHTATELRMYEDRPKHTKSFRDFFADLNRSLNSTAIRRPITAEVIQGTEADLFLDPVTEIAQIQSMINANNAAILAGTAPPRTKPYAIKRDVFFTGYLLAPTDIDRLKSLVKLPSVVPEHEVRFLANNILITPRPAPRSVLDKVGGVGHKVRWRVTGIGAHQNRVWAARVQPCDARERVYTENSTPCVVLATRKDAKPVEVNRIHHWTNVAPQDQLEFESVVGEKVLLRIEVEDAPTQPQQQVEGRKRLREEDFPPLGSNRPKAQQRSHQQAHPQGSSWAGNRGNRGGGGGDGQGFAGSRGGGGGRGGRGGAGSGRGFRGNRGNERGRGGGGAGGRGGRGAYRSLDDNPGQGDYGSAGGMQY